MHLIKEEFTGASVMPIPQQSEIDQIKPEFVLDLFEVKSMFVSWRIGRSPIAGTVVEHEEEVGRVAYG
tara:strand:+ start:502 stop:705 length:204 start_codon:yes stop_codon:yes gene_type:complete